MAAWPSLAENIRRAIVSLIGPALLLAAVLLLLPSRAAAASPERAPAQPPAARTPKVEGTAARKPLVRVWPCAAVLVFTLAGTAWAAPSGPSKPGGRRWLLWTAAVVPLAAVVLVLCCHTPRPQVGPDWTPQRLREELERVGVVYKGRALDGSYFLKRPSDPMPWDDLAALWLARPAAFCAHPGRLMVTHGGGHLPQADLLQFGPLVIRGHPDELRRVAEALGD